MSLHVYYLSYLNYPINQHKFRFDNKNKVIDMDNSHCMFNKKKERRKTHLFHYLVMTPCEPW